MITLPRSDRRSATTCRTTLALAGLLLAALALALGHTALAPAVDHADCLLCHGLHHLLPAATLCAGVLLGFTALCAPRLRHVLRRRCRSPFRVRAPPFHLFV